MCIVIIRCTLARVEVYVKLVLSANRKSYVPRRLAKYLMTLSFNGRFTVRQYRLFQKDMHCDESHDVNVTLLRPIGAMLRPIA